MKIIFQTFVILENHTIISQYDIALITIFFFFTEPDMTQSSSYYDCILSIKYEKILFFNVKNKVFCPSNYKNCEKNVVPSLKVNEAEKNHFHWRVSLIWNSELESYLKLFNKENVLKQLGCERVFTWSLRLKREYIL